MTIRYDAEADAAYISVGPEPAPGESADQVVEITNPQGRGEIILDFDKAGHLIGVEVLTASILLRPQALSEAIAEDVSGLPEPPA